MAEMLRFATAGSVDDGKSTLIGRLLLDTKQIFEDQLESVERTSRDRGFDYTNLALLTDGLRAEREQGITIDVAYRYFATPKRKFIIADTPGHVQYTRNMVTGASTADLALVLIDARKGVLEQSRRHAVIASLLQVKHLVLCVNKMDLVDYAQERFDEICEEFTEFATKLEIDDLTFIPVSALHGDNITTHSLNMPWFEGPTLLHYLEHVYIASDRNLIDMRFPVQYVIRPMSHDHHDYRGYAGQVASGSVRPGDEVVVLPSGFTTTVAGVDMFGGPIEEGFPPMSVSVRLADEIDISRGDMIARPHNLPTVTQDVDAMVCWFSEQPLRPGATYLVKHTTRSAKARVQQLHYRLDVNTLHRDESEAAFRRRVPPESDHRQLHSRRGRDVRDRWRGDGPRPDGPLNVTASSPNVVWHESEVPRDERWSAAGVRGATVWLTGLSGSGKSTVASALTVLLTEQGALTYTLDGDNLRHGLNGDLGFSADDRAENVRRVGEVARLFADAGVIAIVPLISPYRAGRDHARALHTAAGLPFVEVFVDTPIEVCEQRDPKGLYAKARSGELTGFTGIDDPYEPPVAPEVILRGGESPELAAALVAEALDARLAQP
jgi:bifunctional enzyme CysN/CysC